MARSVWVLFCLLTFVLSPRLLCRFCLSLGRGKASNFQYIDMINPLVDLVK